MVKTYPEAPSLQSQINDLSQRIASLENLVSEFSKE